MPWDWPVDCNYIEASAFCTWKNRKRDATIARGEIAQDGLVYRLPTEDEYNRMREFAYPAEEVDPVTGEIKKNDQPYWSQAPGNINLESGYASSCPVDRFSFGSSGLYDVVGNVWQWSCSPLMPYRGFSFHPMYDDFSIPTFDQKHSIFCGGSWISTGNEASRQARFAFRKHFFQHAGFRYILAKPLSAESNAVSICETDPAVAHMLEAGFNDLAQVKLAKQMRMVPEANYAARIAQVAWEVYREHGSTGTPLVADEAPVSPSSSASSASSASTKPTPTSLSSPGPRAIDLGCACGRSTFELAKLAAASSSSSSASSFAPAFNHILGLDFSTRFIRIAAQLQFEGHAEYALAKEGSLLSYHSIESVAGVEPAHLSAAASAPFSSSSNDKIDISVSASPSILDLDLSSRSMQHRVEFLQGDACNLSSKYTGFDLVLAANLLEFLSASRTHTIPNLLQKRTEGI